MITDKKLINKTRFVEIVDDVLSGGGNILQLRHKDSTDQEIIILGRRLLAVTRKHGVPLIVNDSPELALEIEADGVHLGEDDGKVEDARKLLGSDAIIGVSCYNQIERAVQSARAGADYVAMGTPYSTPTKPGREPTSFETLKEAKSRIGDVPIFAIGGITVNKAADVLRTGVDGIAVITSVFGADDPKKAASELAAFFD